MPTVSLVNQSMCTFEWVVHVDICACSNQPCSLFVFFSVRELALVLPFSLCAPSLPHCTSLLLTTHCFSHSLFLSLLPLSCVFRTLEELPTRFVVELRVSKGRAPGLSLFFMWFCNTCMYLGMSPSCSVRNSELWFPQHSCLLLMNDRTYIPTT